MKDGQLLNKRQQDNGDGRRLAGQQHPSDELRLLTRERRCLDRTCLRTSPFRNFQLARREAHDAHVYTHLKMWAILIATALTS